MLLNWLSFFILELTGYFLIFYFLLFLSDILLLIIYFFDVDDPCFEAESTLLSIDK